MVLTNSSTSPEEVSFSISSSTQALKTEEDEELENLCKDSKWSFPAAATSPVAPPPSVETLSPSSQDNKGCSEEQIENFISEYQELQNQMAKMQVACESLRKAKVAGSSEIERLKATIENSAGVLEKEVEHTLSCKSLDSSCSGGERY